MTWKFRTPLYVGAMNDALFIIDAPPSPSGTDAPPDTPHDCNVIAKVSEEIGPEANRQASSLFAASPQLAEALAAMVYTAVATTDAQFEAHRKAEDALAKAGWVGPWEREQ